MGTELHPKTTVVTLTSDFGLKDYYLPVIKGAILSVNPATNIVDITHQIENYNIVEAAFVVKNAWKNFPLGTIHIISVNDFAENSKGFLAIQYGGHYFLGPDNGIFSLLFSDTTFRAYRIKLDVDSSFPLKDIYASAVAHIQKNVPIAQIGEYVEEVEQRINLRPVITHSRIQGSVIHIDTYENVIINIGKNLFDQVGHGRNFNIYFKRHDPIKSVQRGYYDVPIGETVAFFNSAKFLEIAINMGKASSLLDLKLEDTVQIDFH